MKIFGVGIAGCIALAFFYGNAFAEGIDLGACKLHPAVKVTESYEDNIFQLSNDTRSDYITIVTPGLSLDFKCNGKNTVKAEYNLDIQRYDRYKDGDKENSRFNFTAGLYGYEYFLKLREDYKQVTEATTYEARFSNYDFNDVKAVFGRDKEPDKFSFEAFYENLNYDYADIDSASSYNENIFDITGFYGFLPKTKALIEYKFGKLTYENDEPRSGEENEFLAGVKGELAQKMTGTVKAGYQRRDYKSKEDWNKPVMYADIVYEVSKKTRLDLTLERTAEESTFTAQNFYETAIAGCRLSQEITAKTGAYLNVAFNSDKYPDVSGAAERRKDSLWDAKIGFDTKSRKWFSFGASYEYKNRNSNIHTYDYDDNIASIYAKAAY